MPTYDYRCAACGREVEVMHSIHDQGPETCAACGGTMTKVLSPPAIHFKGSGWAKKDAATKAKPTSSTSGTGTDTGKDAAAGDTTSGDKKSDTSTAAASTAGAQSSSAGKGD